MGTRIIVWGALFCSAACVATSAEKTERSSSSTTAADASCVSTVDIRNTLGGSLVLPRDLSEPGHVVGTAMTGDGAMHAFRWSAGVMTDLGTLGGASSDVLAVNAHGDAVGYSALPGEETNTRATLWRRGEIIDLGTLGGDFSIAADVNGAGQVVGNALTADGKTHAFLWQGGTMTDLGTLGGDFSVATRINERGQVLGTSRVPGDDERHVYLWEAGTMTDLGPESGDLDELGDVVLQDGSAVTFVRGAARTPVVPFGDARATFVRALGDRGHVVGTAVRADDRTFPFLWENGTTTRVGPEERAGDLTPLAVNGLAQVVGFVGSGEQPRAFSWKDGLLTYLAPEGEKTMALSVNDRGQILGTTDGGARASLWQVRPCDGTDAGGTPVDAGGTPVDAGGGPPIDAGGSPGDAGDDDGGEIRGGKSW